MRAVGLFTALVVLCLSPQAGAWSEATHQQLTSDALSSVKWLDRYQNLKVTPFKDMVHDVLGPAKAAGPKAFNFKSSATRQEKRQKYLASTAEMSDATVQQFARSLLLSNQTSFGFALGENKGQRLSARQVLAGYSGEPDWGMDKGLDVSRHQKLMGGTDPKQTSSQGFRHMSFLLGTMGEAPQRAQLFFDLGAKAIKKGHEYWGFRLTALGLHYLEDMGTPVHTNMLPTLKYVRIKGMVRPRGQDGKRHLNKGVLGDLVKGSAQINANYHFLYEHFVDKAYTAKDGQAKALSSAVQGNSGKRGWLGRLRGRLGRLFAPRSVKSVARRRAWSRLSTPAIARNAIRYFGEKFRQPATGAPDNSVRSVTEASVKQVVSTANQRRSGEGQRAFTRRMASRDVVMRRTTQQFRKTGVALRRAVHLLGRQVGQTR